MRSIPQPLWLQYISAIGEATSYPSPENITFLQSVAERMAELSRGRSQLHLDLVAAEKDKRWEVFNCLSAVMKTKAESALMLRELYTRALEEVSQPNLPPKKLGFSHRWHPLDPVYPNDETIRKAIGKMPCYGQGFEDLARLAFKAVFKREWEKEFTGFDGREVSLTSDGQGWDMRESVISRTVNYIKDATTLSPLDVSQKCCVFDGQRIFYAEKVEESPFEAELLNVTLTNRSGVRSTHRDEIWVCFPQYSL